MTEGSQLRETNASDTNWFGSTNGELPTSGRERPHLSDVNKTERQQMAESAERAHIDHLWSPMKSSRVRHTAGSRSEDNKSLTEWFEGFPEFRLILILCYLLLLSLDYKYHLYPEDEGRMLLRNAGTHPPDYMVRYPNNRTGWSRGNALDMYSEETHSSNFRWDIGYTGRLFVVIPSPSREIPHTTLIRPPTLPF
jgi:hypothetical protein